MSKVIVLIGMLIISLHSWSQSNVNIVNSKWIKEGELCYDTLQLLDVPNYIQYYCDTEYTERGQFKIIGDTLTLTALETSAFIRERFGKRINQIPDNSELIPISVVKYIVLNSRTIKQCYFKDLISGYVTDETGWEYSKVSNE